ncbi:hypothetical protein ACX80U_13125 [Arthrobacter sp. TmT3-37]
MIHARARPSTLNERTLAAAWRAFNGVDEALEGAACRRNETFDCDS